MSKSPKSPKTEEMTYEEAHQALAELVDTMEQGETPLESLVSNFEQGMALLKTCQKHLATAETKIELIKEKDGEISSEDVSI